MGDLWTNAVRHPEDTGIGYLRRTITFDQFGATSTLGIPIGGLEAGAVIRACDVTIETAFAGTTPTVEVGTPADTDGFATSAGAAAAAAGFKPSLVGAQSGIPLPANTVAYVKVGGTALTAGKATVVVMFSNKREIEGIPFPAN